MLTQQDIYAVGSENRPPMLNKDNYIPWSSCLLHYAKSIPNGKLIYNSIINGPYVRRMIPEPGDASRTTPVPETFHEQTDDELTEAEIKQMEADDQPIQTILLGLPEYIYAAVDSCETAQEIWLCVQQMMKGSDIGIQEKKAKLFNEWERFTSTDGESIESYYHRFSKLMNDFKRNKHFPEKIASNLKFLNNLQLEWSRRVTIVHQTKDLHTADYTQMYDFLKYNQKEVDELRAERLVVQNPGVQNVRNQNRVIVVPGIANQNRNGNLVAARAEGNANGNNAVFDEIEEVNANCILMANLQQASTSGTQSDKAPVYDSDGSTEVQLHDNCYDDEIFNINDLVTGLPKFKYHKEHLCPSCEQGKSKRASHPPKPVPNSKKRLHLLHMDLCGPMRIASINRKRYVLVTVDDYSRYTWVIFLRSKDEAPEEIKTFLKKITVLLQAPVIIVRTDNGTEFKNQVLQEYFNSVGISHQASYNDHEDTRKLGAKGNIGFFIGYSANSYAYRVYKRRTKKIMETMNVTFDELSTMAFKQSSLKLGLQSMTSGHISSGLDLSYAPSTITTQTPTKGELDLLFEAMYDNHVGGQPLTTPRTVPAAQAPQVLQTPTATTTIADTASTPTNSSSQATNFPSTSQNVDELETQQQHVQHQPATIADNVPNAMFDDNVCKPFATPSTSAAESPSSQYVDPSNMYTFYQPYPHEYQWTKDHPLEQVIGEPSRPILIRNQLRTDGDMCMYALTVSTIEPNNVNEAMNDPAWIESMQEELL
ncbi:integrase, catalytic region, zinc finger, CCHC-type containing protein [Tanacetum coccineum]